MGTDLGLRTHINPERESDRKLTQFKSCGPVDETTPLPIGLTGRDTSVCLPSPHRLTLSGCTVERWWEVRYTPFILVNTSKLNVLSSGLFSSIKPEKFFRLR